MTIIFLNIFYIIICDIRYVVLSCGEIKTLIIITLSTRLINPNFCFYTWKLQLPLTAVHFSKQNSTLVAEFNSNLKISGGAQAPSVSPPATSLKIELNRIDFLYVSNRIG